MDAEKLRGFLLSLGFSEETQRDGKLVFWVGAKALGGKMFVLIELDNQRTSGRERPPLLSFSAGDLYEELLGQDAFLKAPYLARARWVALPLSTPVQFAEITRLLRHAHETTYLRLSPHTISSLRTVAVKRSGCGGRADRDPSAETAVQHQAD
jgi:predicted DNA-binding protein (MmcQ/YjbR family)